MTCPDCLAHRTVPDGFAPSVECIHCDGTAYPPGHPALEGIRAPAPPKGSTPNQNKHSSHSTISTREAAFVLDRSERQLRRAIEQGFKTPAQIGSGFAWTIRDLMRLRAHLNEREAACSG